METFRKIAISIFAVVAFSGLASAQSTIERIKADPTYGDNPDERMECAANLSSMAEYVEVGAMDLAYGPWESCYLNCPASRKNIYIMGANILKYRIKNAETEDDKNMYIDTLMNLYDKRFKYDFCDESYALGKKGIDLLTYRVADIKIAYGYLKKSVEISGNDVEEAAAVYLMNASNGLFQTGEIEGGELINDYVLSMDALDKKLIAVPKKKVKINRAKEQVEKIFAESGAANTDALVKIFTPKYEAAPDDVDLLKKIITLLENTDGGEDAELYAKALESLYIAEPSAEAASDLAKLFAGKEDYTKAKDYYTKAIEQSEDDIMKADYYYQLAAIAVKQEDYPMARKQALEAIKLRADFGDAYILIGNCYVATKCGNTDFEKAAVYLVAVDKFSKAKAVDPSVAEKADELINRYKKYFPNKEKAFFEGYTDGKTYTVGCWINESTTVRTSMN